MESREVLSAGLAGAPPAVPTQVIPPPHHELVLNGLLEGRYSASSFPDAGTTYALSGKGQVAPLGQTSVTGSLHSLGFILHGHAGGTLTLADARGTVTLQLTGPLQNGFSPLPTRFSFVITGGTGAFAHDTGRGTAYVTLMPDTPPALRGQLGHFELRLVGAPDAPPS
jgi:hypothetical protein